MLVPVVSAVYMSHYIHCCFCFPLGAVIDKCGNCTGGNTGLAKNYRLDCGKTCGKHKFNEALKICVRSDFDMESVTRRLFCDGAWGSDAFINR